MVVTAVAATPINNCINSKISTGNLHNPTESFSPKYSRAAPRTTMVAKIVPTVIKALRPVPCTRYQTPKQIATTRSTATKAEMTSGNTVRTKLKKLVNLHAMSEPMKMHFVEARNRNRYYDYFEAMIALAKETIQIK